MVHRALLVVAARQRIPIVSIRSTARSSMSLSVWMAIGARTTLPDRVMTFAVSSSRKQRATGPSNSHFESHEASMTPMILRTVSVLGWTQCDAFEHSKPAFYMAQDVAPGIVALSLGQMNGPDLFGVNTLVANKCGC